MDRGFDRLMIVLGVDHHGYVPRFKNAFEALGHSPDHFEALLYNFVYVVRDGEIVKSSKRAGNVITSDEILEEVDAAAGRVGAGKDALRFQYLSRSANVKLDFDIELAKKASLDNPVFYVQYGHARLCSILRKAEELGIDVPDALPAGAWAKLDHADELAITMRLSELPAVIASAAETREPHKVAFYVQDLARDFQSYFTRMKSDPILPRDSDRAEDGWQARWDMDKTRARLAWVRATRVVYRTALELLGVDAVDRMDRPQDADATEEDGA
jgi:arginyl-tRNA synthetase